jgi:uncharacterized protein
MSDMLISCDDHMDLAQLPADLWETRLPSSLSDRAPHIEKREGQSVWVCDGRLWGRWDGDTPNLGRKVKPFYNAFDRAGMYDPSERRPAIPEKRLADMDLNNIRAQVIYGPVVQISTEEPVLRAACYSAYNDWLLDDFCSAAPDRLLGVPMLPENPEPAVFELSRLIAKGGIRQVNLSVAGTNPPISHRSWNELWKLLEDNNILLSWHIILIDAQALPTSSIANIFELTKVFTANFLDSFIDLFAYTILERHPNLHIIMAEGGTGWLPWFIQDLDYRFWRLHEATDYWEDKGLDQFRTKPSDLFRKQVWVTFQDDQVAMSLIPFFGEGHLLWASDYPHPDSVWPNSHQAIDRQMKDLSAEMRRKLTYENAAALYEIS